MVLEVLTGAAIGVINGTVIGNGLEKKNKRLKLNLKKGVKETMKDENVKTLALAAMALGLLALSDIKLRDEKEERRDVQKEVRAKSDKYLETILEDELSSTQSSFKQLASVLKDFEENEVDGAEIDLFGSSIELNKLEVKGLASMDNSEIDDYVYNEFYKDLEPLGKQIINEIVEHEHLDSLKAFNKRMDKVLNK